MTADDDFIGQLEDYLESFEGTTPLPDRVRDAVRTELPWTRQVNPRLGLVRRTNMSSTSTLVRWAALAAALVVVVLGATILLPGSNHAVVSPSPAPTATATATPTPAASLQALALASEGPCGSGVGHTCLSPGTYELGSAVPGARVDVPGGWFEWDPGPGSVGLLVDRPDIDGSGWGLIIAQVGDVVRDPCHVRAGIYPAGQLDTPEKFAAAIAAWPGFHATAPERITVGGIAGVRVRLTWPNDPSACSTPTFWRTPAGTPIDGYPVVDGGSTRQGDAYPADYSLINVDGHLLAVRTMASAATSPNERGQGIADDPTRHQRDVDALLAILDSIRFDGGGS
jgi:hypothetical protein